MVAGRRHGRKLPRPVVLPADLEALHRLAAGAVTQKQLHLAGFLSMPATGALHRYGYQCRPWLHLASGRVVLVYSPRWPDSPLPYLTIESYLDQCAVHHALGLSCVQPGALWEELPDAPLFDSQTP